MKIVKSFLVLALFMALLIPQAMAGTLEDVKSKGVLTLGVVLQVWAGWRWYAERSATHRAVRELAACRQLATEIAALKSRPKSAVLQPQTDQQITLAIQQAAQFAEIPDGDILRITPQQGRRLGKSPHIQQPTTVEIRQATLGQISRFLAELSVTDMRLQPTSIRLSAPRMSPEEAGATRTERWSCEFVLTYLVFSPE